MLPIGSVTADARVEATFAILRTLRVEAQANGSVVAKVDGADAVTIKPGPSQGFAVTILSAATLTATADAGWAFAGWAVAGDVRCAGDAQDNPCVLLISSITADATVWADFDAVPTTLTVTAGANGSVAAEIDGAGAVTVTTEQGFAFSVEASATLTATAASDYRFDHWTLSGGLACAAGTASNICVLPTRSVTADATVDAVFIIQTALTVTARRGGSVAAEVDEADAVTVNAGSRHDFTAVTDMSTATLTATTDNTGWTFAGWTVSDGTACAGGTQANPCALEEAVAGATVEAVFDVILTKLRGGAGANGQIKVGVVGGGSVVHSEEFRTVEAGNSLARPHGLNFSILSSALLRAIPHPGYELDRWSSPSNHAPPCKPGTQKNFCEVPVGTPPINPRPGRPDALGIYASAIFKATPTTLTVTTGANGSVAAEVGGGGEMMINPSRSQDFAFSVEASATLTATAASDYRFARWTLSGPSGPACADGTDPNICELPTGSLRADARVEAIFIPLLALTVEVRAGGSVAAEVDEADADTVVTMTVNAGSHHDFITVTETFAATLTATADAGWAFASWTLSSGSACAGGTASNICALASAAGATIEAVFELVPSTLTATADPGGSVFVKVNGNDSISLSVVGDFPQTHSLTVDVLSAVSLEALPDNGYLFTGWTLSGGLACAGGGGTATANPCVLAAGSVTTDTTVSAAFELGPSAAWRGPGSVSVSLSGGSVMHTAVPYAAGAFEGWVGNELPSGCLKALACDVSLLRPRQRAIGPNLPVAMFRPFVVDGIKSLAFGLGYHGADPDHLRVFFQDAPSAGFTPVAGLGDLRPDAVPALARLQVPVHLWPWDRGSYLTEVCGASNSCVAASGGEQALEQSDSVAATGYFKAPNADADDQFGGALALSADGSTLAVGAVGEDSASAGVFAPGDVAGYQPALESDGEANSGAVTVYRRSDTDVWAIEAFVKAPNAGANDQFGTALALSADGATLAVGAPYEGSASAGVFAPGDVAGYQTALESDGEANSGAVTVYRRSGSAWSIEAFVKAPVAGANDQFGTALALSADGATLAVGAPYEGSASAGVFAPGDVAGYQTALESDGEANSGAVTVYRRSDANVWAIEAFVKAPNAGGGDQFGAALALDSSGTTLAVGANFEDSASTGTFVAGNSAGYQDALRSNGVRDSGAVTVYRRSGSAWSIEAFVKAPNVDVNDQFGRALALDSSGTTLAVGALYEFSASTGVFAPRDVAGYQTALESDGEANSGAVTVYRRSDANVWAIEAFVKAPNVEVNDQFGTALALSADGATLAVGANFEDSLSAGVFAPGDTGYQAALRSNGVRNSGAVTIYRRSDTDAWEIKAFVKTPNVRRLEPFPGRLDQFGDALALSRDGTTLAVGARFEDGGAQSQPVGGNSADTRNAVEDSGAVYLY